MNPAGEEQRVGDQDHPTNVQTLPVMELGIAPLHFGIMMVLNLCIGLCTPPVGSVLFLGCGIGETTITKLFKPLIPFYIALIIALMLITYIPDLSTWLPKVFGY